jgi:hypothetical protein
MPSRRAFGADRLGFGSSAGVVRVVRVDGVVEVKRAGMAPHFQNARRGANLC